MLENLTKRLDLLFKKIRGRGLLTEQNIDETLREVRLALLEADVHFKVVQSFMADVRKKAVGAEVLESLTPGQQVVKIVWQELCSLLGPVSSGNGEGNDPGISFGTVPTKLMLVGLQGTGKTTTAAKLGFFYKQKGKKVLLVATDLRRPAACAQLHTLADSIGVPIILPVENESLFSVVARGLEAGQAMDLVIFDTAGRIEMDEPLMQEMAEMKSQVAPEEIFLVADAMTGQTAVNVAERFHQKMGITGIILTKTEGDARGGALLSMRAMTGAPVRFIGVGEKVVALEPFHPDRIASRILGMGDIRSLVERVEKHLPRDTRPVHSGPSAPSNRITLDDFKEQLVQIKKMGDMGNLLDMIPGVRGRVKLPDSDQMGKELRRTEAILSSMTRQERQSPEIINGSRRLRIAQGSGTSVPHVNRLLKQFYQAQKMLKAAPVYGRGGGGKWKNPLRTLFSAS